MVDTSEIIIGLRNNAKLSIELGVEDYIAGKKEARRNLSAIRNLYGGLLLLYKSHLAHLSQATSCSILNNRFDWEVVDGNIVPRPLSLTDKTVDLQGILTAFKKLGIRIDSTSLEKIRKYRNQTEHLFDVNKLHNDIVRTYVVDLMKLVRDFMTSVMGIAPRVWFPDSILRVILNDEDIVKRERQERDTTLSSLRWYKPFIKDLFALIVCPDCQSELLFPHQNNIDAYNAKFTCRSCGHIDTYENLMSYFTDDVFLSRTDEDILRAADGTYLLNKEELSECPECSSMSFAADHGLCLVCGHLGICLRCEETITEEDMPAYLESKLCNYCYHMTTKDD